MPRTTPRTKKARRQAMADEMHRFKAGELHAGSPDGPVVTDRAQAIAIGLKVSGLSKRTRSKKGSVPGVSKTR